MPNMNARTPLLFKLSLDVCVCVCLPRKEEQDAKGSWKILQEASTARPEQHLSGHLFGEHAEAKVPLGYDTEWDVHFVL